MGWPVYRVPAAEIAKAGATEVSPGADFGGWGLRMAPGRRFGIGKDRFVIGRGRNTSDLCIANAQISRQSAIVEFVGDAFWLVDLGATNGPTVNGNRIARWRLKNGDVFELGGTHVRYEEG